MRIRVSINNTIKAVQFWCSKSDCQKDDIDNIIHDIFNSLSLKDKAKYRAVVYRSGDRELTSATADLLRHNLGH